MQDFYIYIDHTLADEKIAFLLQNILIDSNVSYVIQRYSQAKDSSHDNWESVIPKILNHADVILVITSNNYLDNFITDEISNMLNLIVESDDRFVFPIIVEEIRSEKATWLLSCKSFEVSGEMSVRDSLNELTYLLGVIFRIKLFYTNEIKLLKSEYLKKIFKLEEEIIKNANDELNFKRQIASVKSDLVSLLSQNKIEKVIKGLSELDVINSDMNLKKNLVNCSARFYRLNELISSGILSQDEIFIESNKINNCLIDLINSMIGSDC